jgi:small subunit ribosomal protein S5
MDTEQKTNNVTGNTEAGAGAPVAETLAANPPAREERGKRDFKNDRRGGRGGQRRGGGRQPRASHERARPEFEHKVINVRRVTRVVAGGRRFSFSVAIVAGNRKGSVGVGIGKGGDTALAIEKAMRNAKRHMIKVKLTKHMSIPHDVTAKFSSARILMMPSPGRGIIAGSSVRNVLHLAGMKDVTAKILSGSKNKLNIARVAVKALGMLKDVKRSGEVAGKGAAGVSVPTE